MKLLAVLATIFAVSVQAQPSMSTAQTACSFLAAAGEGAALAQKKGVPEEITRQVWLDNVDQNASGEYAESIKNIGALEIQSVYTKKISVQSEGYWDGYQTCMGALK